MSSNKVIDIFDTLHFVSDYNSVGLTNDNSSLTIDGGILTLYNSTKSQHSSVGALVLQNGGLSINALTNATSVSNGGALTVAGGAAIAGDLIVGGTITYSNAAAGSSTFSYLTLTASDQSVDIASGALVVFGGISIQTSANATSIDAGGGLTIAGGAAVYSDFYVGGTSYFQDISASNTSFTNVTLSNLIATNSTLTNILTTKLTATSSNITNISSITAIISGGLRAIGNNNTIGNIFTKDNNVGINTTSPNYQLDINGALHVSGTSGTLNILSSSTTSEILQLQNTNISGGNSIQFLNNTGTSKGTFGIGNANAIAYQNTMYMASISGVPINLVAGGYTNRPVIINANDNSVSITCTTDASDINSGALKVSGGVGIIGDLYVGGELIVNSPLNVTINNTRYSLNATTGAMQLIGGLSINIQDSANSNSTSYTAGGGITLSGGLAVAQDVFFGGLLDIRSGSNNMNPIKLQSIQISSNYNNGASTIIQSGDSARTSTSFTPIAFSGWNDQANPKLTINASTIVTGNALMAINNSNTVGPLITTGGNIGIGIATPSASLHINTTNTFGQLFLGNVAQNRKVVLFSTANNEHQFYGFGTTFNTLRYQVDQLDSNHVFYASVNVTNSNELMRITGRGNVVISGSTSTTALSAANLYGTNITVATLNASTGITAGDINFTGSLYKNGTLYVSSQWLGTTGNIVYYGTTGSGFLVGIGTSNPTQALDVVGTIRATTSITTGALYSTNQTTTNIVATNLSAGTFNSGNLTTGNINFTGILSQNGSPYIGSQWSGTTGSLLYYGSSSNLVFVGIGTTNPVYNLDVNGSFRANNLTISGTSNSLNSTTGQYVYNSLSISTTMDATSYTQGGGLTLAGGLAVGKSMILGSSFNMSGIVTDNTGTFAASNNISTPAIITGLLFPTANIRSFTITIAIQLLAGSGTNNLYAQYTIEGIQNSSGWLIDDSYIGDVTGISFNINNTGQLLYTSSNITNWISCTFNYRSTAYSISGNYIQSAPATSGNFIVTQSLTVQGTNDASSASYGSIVTAGGVGIGKSINVGGSVVINNISSTSSGTFNALNGTITNGTITGLLFSTNTYRSFNILMSVSVNRTSGSNYNAQYTIEGIQRDSGWFIYVTTLGDTIDIIFSISTAGQLQYSTTTTYTNWTSTVLNYQTTVIYITGGFNTFTLPNGGQYINDILYVSNTTQSTDTSSGSIIVSGGVGIQKNLNVGSLLQVSGDATITKGLSIAGNCIFTSTGNLGINTTSPSYNLDINGFTRISSRLDIGGTQPSYNGNTIGRLFITGIQNSPANGPNIIINTTQDIYPTYNMLTYGHDFSYMMFDMYYDGSSFRNSFTTTAYQIVKNTGQLLFNYNTSGFSAGAPTITSTAICIGSSGNIGLGGQITPAYTLDINGSGRFTGNLLTSQLAVANTGSNHHTLGTASQRIGIALGGLETGSNVGSDFKINTYNDSGNFINTMLVLTRASGNLSIVGALSKGSGTFDIQHPIVHGKRLVHSFIEGPRCDLIYRGTIKLINGIINVNIDSDCVNDSNSQMTQGTFEALCTNPVKYLHNNDSFERVRGMINGNILTIISENTTSNDTIDWMVIAERKDPFIKQWERTDSNGYLVTEYNSN